MTIDNDNAQRFVPSQAASEHAVVCADRRYPSFVENEAGWLNSRCQDGWRLVCVCHSPDGFNTYYFSREVQL